MVTAYYFGARQSPGTLSVMPGLDPGIHLLRKNALREADGLHRNSGLPEFRIIMSAASRAGPTCGVKPGNDAVSWRARGAIHARQTRSAPSPACGQGNRIWVNKYESLTERTESKSSEIPVLFTHMRLPCACGGGVGWGRTSVQTGDMGNSLDRIHG